MADMTSCREGQYIGGPLFLRIVWLPCETAKRSENSRHMRQPSVKNRKNLGKRLKGRKGVISIPKYGQFSQHYNTVAVYGNETSVENMPIKPNPSTSQSQAASVESIL